MSTVHKSPNPDDIVRAYQSGARIVDIIRNLHTSSRVIRRSLADAGVQVRVIRNNMPPRSQHRRLIGRIAVRSVVSRYVAGESQKSIAESFGVSRQPISRMLKEAGIPIRGVTESIRLAYTKTSKEERVRIASYAFNARRGQRESLEVLCKRAITREFKGLGIERLEVICAEMLTARGLCATLQKAVGPYNVDIALNEVPIAVEIFGGNWHSSGRHAARFRERFDYLLDHGWFPVIIWVGKRHPLEAGAIDYIVALAERLRQNESVLRKEKMILGDGQPAPACESYLNH